ncbi:calmodulin-2/4-like [Haliotis rubra]|uniref:calmodulin-2/4-like n=1 Tax=Haliotis rubra TaxID=36100 RepID=UPI001EE5CCB1|nr:calmodulin-2/4-like [Haliotis rubra]
MICLLVLAFAYGALSAPSTAPDLATTFKQAFSRIDSDGSGTADVSEFLNVFDHYDLNHDGKMTLAEYMSVNKVPKYIAQAVFKPVDADHDDVLQRTEVNNVVAAFDTDGDGVVSLAEFVNKYQQIFASLPNPPVGK